MNTRMMFARAQVGGQDVEPPPRSALRRSRMLPIPNPIPNSPATKPRRTNWGLATLELATLPQWQHFPGCLRR